METNAEMGASAAEETPKKRSKRFGMNFRPISYEIKKAILDAVDNNPDNRKKIDIAKDFVEHGVNQSTFFSILSQRQKILEFVEEHGGSALKRTRKARARKVYPDVDQALAAWCKKAESEGVHLHRPMVKDKALELAKELNQAGFDCNKSWLRTFKMRHGFQFEHLTLEELRELDPVKSPLVGHENVAQVLQGYSPRDVYAVGSFVLYWSTLSTSCAFRKLQQIADDQMSKRITVLMGANMDGNDKLKLRAVITGESLPNLKDLKGNRSNSVSFAYSKNALMTQQIFTEWVKHLDKLYYTSGRRACFVVSETEGFAPVLGLRAIKLLCLPRNESVRCQPCRQGVVQYFKTLYRLRLLHRLTSTKTEWKAFTLMDSLHMLQAAWKDVTVEQIQHAFENAGFQIEVAFNGGSTSTQHVAASSNNSDSVVVEKAPQPQPVSTVSFHPVAGGHSNDLNHTAILENIRKSLEFPSSLKKLSLTLAVEQFWKADEDIIRDRSSLASDESSVRTAGPESSVSHPHGSETATSSSQVANGSAASAPPNEQQAKEAVETLKRYFESQPHLIAPVAKHCLDSLQGIKDTVDIVSNSACSSTS